MGLAYEFDPRWLRRRYIKEKKSIREMATEAEVSPSSIYRALQQLGVEMRGHSPRPGKGSGTKLSDAEIKKIRTMWEAEDWTQSDLANKFKVSRQTINSIVNNRTHQHIK